MDHYNWPETASVPIEGHAIKHMDSAGAWLLQKCILLLEQQHKAVDLSGFSDKQQSLINMLSEQTETIGQLASMPAPPGTLYTLGKTSIDKYALGKKFLAFIGESAIDFYYSLLGRQRASWRSILANIDDSGFKALPIIGLLLFLIGIVVVYQMGLQLKVYGANIFIVNISGMAILREFGPLITAIIVAGRTGSAYTAQIGTMKVNQEVDALQTMGISPLCRLALPKIFALLIVMPLLTTWADITGILGSMFMSESMLNVPFADYLQRFPNVVDSNNYWIGLGKAPVFALIIATVGCFQGFQVTGSADSVGHQTTKSVVQAIFLIIIADAVFSILYSWTGI